MGSEEQDNLDMELVAEQELSRLMRQVSTDYLILALPAVL